MTNDKQQVETPIGTSLGKFFQGYNQPTPDQSTQLQAEAERELTSGEQPNPDAAAYHAFHRFFGTPKIDSGYFHSTMGPGDDAEMQFGKPAPATTQAKADGTAPTVSPPPADNTAGNPAAANGGASAVGSAMGPPPGAVDLLRKNPGMASMFDQKYGVGASQRYLSGT